MAAVSSVRLEKWSFYKKMGVRLFGFRNRNGALCFLDYCNFSHLKIYQSGQGSCSLGVRITESTPYYPNTQPLTPLNFWTKYALRFCQWLYPKSRLCHVCHWGESFITDGNLFGWLFWVSSDRKIGMSPNVCVCWPAHCGQFCQSPSLTPKQNKSYWSILG